MEPSASIKRHSSRQLEVKAGEKELYLQTPLPVNSSGIGDEHRATSLCAYLSCRPYRQYLAGGDACCSYQSAWPNAVTIIYIVELLKLTVGLNCYVDRFVKQRIIKLFGKPPALLNEHLVERFDESLSRADGHGLYFSVGIRIMLSSHPHVYSKWAFDLGHPTTG